MKKIKKLDEFEIVNEMAKDFPVGTIVRVNTSRDLGINDYGWRTLTPQLLPGASMEDGVFYMKITSSGRKWMEGPLLVGNCLINQNINHDVRANKNNVSIPGRDWKIIEADLKNNHIGKVFYIDGKEAGLMDVKGEEKDIQEGEYIARSYNFALTAKFGTPVLVLESKNKKNWFCAKTESLETFDKELSPQQKTVIAEWFSNALDDADITVNGSSGFTMKKWKIQSKTSNYPCAFSAGPFANKKQAQLVLESLKKINKYSLFDPETAYIDSGRWETQDFTIDELIAWCKDIGIKTTLKELLNLRKGSVAAQNFGI